MIYYNTKRIFFEYFFINSGVAVNYATKSDDGIHQISYCKVLFSDGVFAEEEDYIFSN